MGRRALLILLLAMAAVVHAPQAGLGAATADVVRSAERADRVIALTFDDGWQPGRCAKILDTLERFDVPATWFPNAIYMSAAPGLWRRIAKRDPIANHTTHHLMLTGRSAHKIRKEIRSDERRIEKLTGRPMAKILRPPYGAVDGRVRREAARLGYKTIALWSVSANDTSPRATDRGVAKAALRGRPGSIVLMHCGPDVTPRVLPIVIARYACAGFRFATVEALLAGKRGVKATANCPPPALPARPASKRVEQAGSGPADISPGAAVAGTEWRLSAAADGAALEPVPPEVVLTLRFEPRRVSGLVGCDVYTARSSMQPDGVLGLGRLTRSFDACPPAAERAAGYLDVLMATASQRIVDDALELLDAEGRTMLRFVPSGPSGLIGDWVVTAMADETGALLAPDVASPMTVTFGTAGALTGSTGCTAYRGGYSTLGGAVATGPLLAAAGSCPGDAAGAGVRLLAALRSAAAWDLLDGSLQLRDADGMVILALAPAPPVG